MHMLLFPFLLSFYAAVAFEIKKGMKISTKGIFSAQSDFEN